MLGIKLQRIYEIVEGTTNDRAAKGFQYFIVAFILLNVFVVILETEDSLFDKYWYFFTPFNIFAITVFTVEYIIRISVCHLNPKYKNSKFSRLRFILSPMMLVDLAAILPFFLPFVISDTRFIRIIRLLRIFALFRLPRYSESLSTLGAVFWARVGDLVVAFFIFFIMVLLSASLMYYAEHNAQPDVFSSIPSALWWSIITLTTIGYGDTYPVTTMGKIVGAGVAISGIAVYAVLTGIITSAFTEALRKRKKSENTKRTCPHCGKEVVD